MSTSLSVLRRLVEQHDYGALREACLGADDGDRDVRILLALADAHLGDVSAARRTLTSIESGTLALPARVDLAAVHIALGELNSAIAILESARRESAGQPHADCALLLARLAWCRLQQDRGDEALTLYQQSLSLGPRIAVYHNLMALYRDNGQLTEMAACLDSAFTFWEQTQADWPDGQRRVHRRRLRGMQVELWLARDDVESAEAWIDGQHDALDEDDWCDLVCEFAQRLAARGRHAQAEEWLRTGLRRYPQHVSIHVQIAELAQLQGRTLQAIALLRLAISLANAQGSPAQRLWTRLSAVALLSHTGLARHAAEQAGDPLALAAVEARESNYHAAEQRYRHLLEQRPRLIPALQGLGELCMQLGRIDEAIAVFQRIKAIDPTRGEGALISARRFPEDDATLHRLERLARTPGMEGPVRTGLLFQLAAAWEDREDYDRTFALADEANTASRRLLRYDPRAHRQHCARIRYAFPRALFEHRPGYGDPSTLPVFVVGMPRSGTTLVEQILAGHSRIHGAGELGTIPHVIAGLERWERHTGSGRRYPDCVDDLDAQVISGIAANVLKELREYAPGADHMIDKLPHNFENIGLIHLLFPRAKIISVRRDPRDIAISNYFTDYAAKNGGMGFAYDLDWIGEQLADHNLLMHHWQQVCPEAILEVRYEDVVGDPQAAARRMLDHIGVDWEPRVLDFSALQRPVKTASVWQVRQPLYASSKARWQRYRQHLAPLLAGTNRKIVWDAIEMVTLPEPGWLNTGVDCYRAGDLDGAEYRFKQLLQHLPEHAAGRFLLGLVYIRKGHLGDGIALMAQGLERCPWNRRWRDDLIQAYRLAGRHRDAATLAAAGTGQVLSPQQARAGEETAMPVDYLFSSGESP
jgi:tetratricopeptide (TPR) repeat protein